VLTANAAYVKSFGAKTDLGLPPARRFAILTCMDARLEPAKYAGLAEGDAQVIRNAGEGPVTMPSGSPDKNKNRLSQEEKACFLASQISNIF
jgi:carbonic anhydrase